VAELIFSQWLGKSGKRYDYYGYPIPTKFNPNQKGNYVYARKNPNGKWVPVFIGEGDLREAQFNHPQAKCIAEKGATHIHVRVNPLDDERQAETRDMLEIYENAHAPHGCNR